MHSPRGTSTDNETAKTLVICLMCMCMQRIELTHRIPTLWNPGRPWLICLSAGLLCLLLMPDVEAIPRWPGSEMNKKKTAPWPGSRVASAHIPFCPSYTPASACWTCSSAQAHRQLSMGSVESVARLPHNKLGVVGVK